MFNFRIVGKYCTLFSYDNFARIPEVETKVVIKRTSEEGKNTKKKGKRRVRIRTRSKDKKSKSRSKSPKKDNAKTKK